MWTKTDKDREEPHQQRFFFLRSWPFRWDIKCEGVFVLACLSAGKTHANKTEHKIPVFPFIVCFFTYFLSFFTYFLTFFLSFFYLHLFLSHLFSCYLELINPVVDSRLKAWRALVWWLLVWVTQSGSSVPPYICWCISDIFRNLQPWISHWSALKMINIELWVVLTPNQFWCLLNLVDLW